MESNLQYLSSRFHPEFVTVEQGRELFAKRHKKDHSLGRDYGTFKATDYPCIQMESSGHTRSSVEGGVEVDSTTVIKDEGVVETITIASPTAPQPSAMPMRLQADASIATFLRKPFEITSGTFTLAPLAVQSYDVMEYLSTVNLYSSKLRGVYGIKATPVFTVKCNANRFTGGLFGLSFLPTAGAAGGHAQTVEIAQSFSKAQRSHLLTAYLDLNCDSSVQLRVPWVCAYPYWQTRRTGVQAFRGSPGRVLFWEYSPAIDFSGATINASYSIYVHYEDVELYGAAIPQMGDLFDYPEVQAGNAIVKTSRGSKDVLTEEVLETGPISSSLRLVASASGALTSIPSLMPIMAPVSWVSDALARAAHWFGYSAPLLSQPPSRMYVEDAPYLANFDKHSQVAPLSLSVANKLSPSPGFSGTTANEMSIDFVKSRFGFIGSTGWNTGSAPGTLLNTIDITPRAFETTGVDSNTLTWRNPAPVAFLARQFDMWRGSIVIKLRLVKTEFHIGRLVIIFDPLNESTPGAVDSSGAAASYRKILDIRQGSEFDIIVPWVSDVDWKYTHAGNGVVSAGTLRFYVDDQLSFSAGFSGGTINMIYEACGGPDFAVAGRRFSTYNPGSPANRIQCGMDDDLYPEIQSGAVELNSDAKGDAHCASSATKFEPDAGHTGTVQICSHTFGEVVLSLAQLLKAGGLVTSSVQNTGATGFCQISPYHWMYARSQAGAPTTIVSRDPYTMLASCFAMVRGGIRLSIISQLEAGCWVASYKPLGSVVSSIVVGPAGNPLDAGQSSGIYTRRSGSGGLNVQVPYYNILPMSPTNDLGWYGGVAAFPHTQPAIKTILDLVYVDAATLAAPASFFLHRSGADDCEFSGFVSIMPTFTL